MYFYRAHLCFQVFFTVFEFCSQKSLMLRVIEMQYRGKALNRISRQYCFVS